MLSRASFLLIFALVACDAPPPVACQEGTTTCFGQENSILVCTDASWIVESCGDGELCHENACQPLTCRPKASACREGKKVTCSADGSVWSAPESCGANEKCDDGSCVPVICDPGATRCADDANGTELCVTSGTRWVPAGDCDSGSVCSNGACLADTCTPGERTCSSTSSFVCTSSKAWEEVACKADQTCVFGDCVSCFDNSHCAAGESCESGACVQSVPVIVTDTLAEGTVNVSYSAKIVVEGGLPPYAFELRTGALPDGLALTTDGRISGNPPKTGSWNFTIEVTDTRGGKDSQALNLSILSQGELKITTASLKDADLDYPYSVALQAAGGIPPYAWQSLQPLPGGLAMTSTGHIEGTPTVQGVFPLTLRVVDGRTPPGYASRDFTLTVKIAPLEIIKIGNEQEINLFVTKLLTTPILLPIIPYSTTLQARGGLKPYTWTEVPMQTGGLVPATGLPAGLTLAADGKLSGSVTDTSTAVTMNVPLINMNLTGYFFSARVTDSQTPAKTKEAIYFIPTVAF